MSKARLVITAVTIEKRSVAEVVAEYGVSRSWVYQLLARYRDEGATIAELQALLDRFVAEYNQHRPHRSLPHRATPAALYDTMPKALPGATRDAETHDRIRHDIIDKSGSVTLRVHGQLRHIGIGRTHARTHVILLIHDLDVRVVNAVTGELLRELTIDVSRNYQPRTPK
jgi:hypothetical protein